MCSKRISFYDDKNIDRERILIDDKHQLDELICPICLCFLWKPCSCMKCDNRFCQQCIQTWLNTKSLTCPLCRSLYENKPISSWIQTLLASVSIYCRNKSFGCSDILSYDDLEQHEQFNCHFLSKTCSLCEEIIRIQDIDQHMTTCQPVVTECDFCQCLIQIDLYEYHQNECSRQDLIQNNDFIVNGTILSSTSETNLQGLELINQSRRNGYIRRFFSMIKWLAMNLSMIHLILLNLLGWGIGTFIHKFTTLLIHVRTWIFQSKCQAFVYLIICHVILNYSLSFLMKSMDDIWMIFSLISSLILSSSLDPDLQIDQFQMNLNSKEFFLFSIFIFFLLKISLFLIRLYFSYISICTGTVCFALAIISYLFLTDHY
ncbi:hypothetical protein I4U23_001386 [Adineta vaga]|nr:hypothetical protein I4U23_001386 [Adineta vaga]